MIFSTFFLSGYVRNGGGGGRKVGCYQENIERIFHLKKKRKGEEKENISRNDCSISKT